MKKVFQILILFYAFGCSSSNQDKLEKILNSNEFSIISNASGRPFLHGGKQSIEIFTNNGTKRMKYVFHQNGIENTDSIISFPFTKKNEMIIREFVKEGLSIDGLKDPEHHEPPYVLSNGWSTIKFMNNNKKVDSLYLLIYNSHE